MEETKDGVYIYTMEYYSSIKGNETLSFVTTWINLEDIKLSEISQKYKICNVSSYVWNLKTKQMGKYNKTERDSQIEN